MSLQRYCRSAFLLATLVLFSPAARAANSYHSQIPDSLRLAPGDGWGDRRVAETPYRIAHGDRITISVEIDGMGPFDFVVDTASSRTVLFDHVRARLGIATDPNVTMTIYGMIGERPALSVTLDRLRIGEETIRHLEVADLPDPPLDEDEADGILGLDVLEHYALLFDQPDQMLRLYTRSGGLPRMATGWHAVKLRHQRLAKVPCDFWFFGTWIGHAASATLFDLGAGVTVVNWQTAEELGLRKRDFPVTEAAEKLKDVLGKVEQVIMITDLQIKTGSTAWPNQSVLVANSRIFDILGIDGIPSTIIGAGLLKNNSFAIDFRGETLYIL